METAQEPRVDSVWPLVLGCSLLVALSSPFNLILGLLCWGLIATTAGPYAADNSGGGRVLLTVVINVAMFLALCGIAGLPFRRAPLFWRRVVVIVILVLHLAFWLGWSFAVVAHMAATGDWL
jgi:hypothetical protein